MTSVFVNIKQNDKSEAVKDVQQRLCKLGHMNENEVSGTFDARTLDAVNSFCDEMQIVRRNCVDEIMWQTLVDATYSLGDRTLYLRIPHFRGNDCRELQHILGTLGFSAGDEDGVFGAATEAALRSFQQNMGLPNDGICGAFTYQTIRNLHHSWEGKKAYSGQRNLSFARVAEVLENNTVCLFGTCEFTRSIAKRMSNLSIATTPQSKIVSADALSVPPDGEMILFQIVLAEQNNPANINVLYSEDDALPQNIEQALEELNASGEKKMSVTIASKTWQDAKEERSAQHYAINLLDALCNALSHL